MMSSQLDNLAIDKASEIVAEFLSGEKLEETQVIRIRLAVEEILLEYQGHLGENAKFSLTCARRLGKLRIELGFPGERIDPFADNGEAREDGAELMHAILANLGYAPVWQYKNGVNLVTFTPKKKKPSQFRSLLLALVLVLAVACGGASLLLPETVRTFLTADLVGPLFSTFMGVLTAVAGPMIFLSVAWGIYSIGDTATLGRIGKRMIQRFLLISAAVGALAALLYIPCFPFTLSGGGGALNFSELYHLILDMIPGNLLTPFTESNPTQIVAVAAMLGLSLLILGNKATAAATLVEQSNYIVQLLMEGISSLVPCFVFASIFNMIAGGELMELKKAYKLLPLMVAVQLLLLILYVGAVCIRKRVGPTVLLKKMLPTVAICLTTASSSAAFSTNVDCCKQELGIDQRIINFGVPLGQVLFMPGAIIQFLVSALCMAEIYGVEINLGWLITAVLVAVVLAIAAPPVPGGALTSYTMMFIQLDLPADAIAVIIALNMVLEFITTTVNVACLQMELVELSGSLELLDGETLRSSSSLTAPTK